MEIETILREQTELENARVNFDKTYRNLAELLTPYEDEFQSSKNTNPPAGARRTQRVFDSTAILALDRMVAAVNDILTPPTRRWHNLEIEDYAEDDEVIRYLEGVREILFNARYAVNTGFASNIAQTYRSLAAFGVGCLFVDQLKGVGLRYKNIHIGEIYIAENHAGMVDKVHRKFVYTARQAAETFGKDCPSVILQALERTPEKQFEFIHCVKPNPARDPSKLDVRGMEYVSYYVSTEGKQIVRTSGYRTMPYIVARYGRALSSAYGVSPAMMALPDIETLNKMEKSNLRAAQYASEPVMLGGADDGSLSTFNMTPGALISGAIDDQGRVKLQPLNMSSNTPVAIEFADQRRRAINDAFFVTIFQILVEEQRQMTATEVMQRAAEKGALLGTPMAQLQSELLGRIIEREIDILSGVNAFPAPPEVLQENPQDYKIVYTSELARLQRAGDGVAIQRTLEALVPLSQVYPDALSIFKMDAVARELAEINGVPATLMKTEDEMAEENQAKIQQEQTAALLQAAPIASKSALDLAQAQSIAASSPSAVLPNIIQG